MKTIAFVTVAATLLASATSKSSVGGPLTELLILVLAMWAVGIHEAWSKNLGFLGWIANIMLSFVGGSAGIAIGSMAMESTLSLVHFEGSLAKSNSPLLYVLSVVMALLTVFGSWGAIQSLNLLRRSAPRSA